MAELKMSLQEWAEYNGLDPQETVTQLIQAGGNAAAFCLEKAEEQQANKTGGERYEVDAFRVLVGRDDKGRVLECTYRFRDESEIRGTELERQGAQMEHSPGRKH